MTTTRWLTRDDLGAAARTATGLLQVAPDASSAWPLDPGETAAGGLTARALRAAGVGDRDRIVVGLRHRWRHLAVPDADHHPHRRPGWRQAALVQ
ncbi:hypothetical protein AB0B89_32365, partial [Sphaerisporangium sp. NPDC049002]